MTPVDDLTREELERELEELRDVASRRFLVRWRGHTLVDVSILELVALTRRAGGGATDLLEPPTPNLRKPSDLDGVAVLIGPPADEAPARSNGK